MARRAPTLEPAFFAVSVVLLAAGFVWTPWPWLLASLLGLAAALAWTVGGLRRREPGVDVIAVLALAGAVAVDELLAGSVITVMLATGRLLEARAAARARRDLGLLVARTPRTARRYEGGALVQVPAERVQLGDRLLVGSGEVLPVDGRLLGPAVLDESALTGEALPVERPEGDGVRSGVVNAGGPCELLATSTAADSTYAGIVRLVGEAQASSAPFVRMADRFAVAFVPVTLLLAGAAWAVSGDAVRAVAVLVVATPCPLLLAAPVAIMSGLSRTSRVGVVVKGGGALERLGHGEVLLFDKTGTLTHGRPVVLDSVTDGRWAVDDLLRLAASLDQVSPHVLAGAVVQAARARGLSLSLPTDVQERPGQGIEGLVDGHRVRLGRAGWVLPAPAPPWARRARRRADLDGSLTVFVGLDGAAAGALLLEDPVRADAPRMLRALRSAGIRRIVLVTGDRPYVAEAVGRVVGVDTVQAERDPGEKLEVVRAERAHGRTVMVGDGVNDAPALAAADVGVALAARGSTASSEAADVVLTVDRLDRLADAILVARRSVRIAWQSVVIGMGLSLVAMVVAALGYLPPTAGALLQEGIDVLAILVALRAVLPGRQHTVQMSAADVALTRRLHEQHASVRPIVEQVRTAAEAIDACPEDLGPARAVLLRLEQELLPHERAEQEELYPVVARLLGGTDPVGAMSRSHAEIEHQVARLGRLLNEIGDAPAEPDDVLELRRMLYVLYGVLRLHNAQEEEGVFALVSAPVPSGQSSVR